MQIQPDESLISFVIRAIHINQYSPKRSLLDDLTPRSSFDTKQLRKIAGLIGWPGCYGFNRLVHNHTMLPAKHVIKSYQDIMAMMLDDGEQIGRFKVRSLMR